jgi:hypothetical protein
MLRLYLEVTAAVLLSNERLTQSCIYMTGTCCLHQQVAAVRRDWAVALGFMLPIAALLQVYTYTHFHVK